MVIVSLPLLPPFQQPTQAGDLKNIDNVTCNIDVATKGHHGERPCPWSYSSRRPTRSSGPTSAFALTGEREHLFDTKPPPPCPTSPPAG